MENSFISKLTDKSGFLLVPAGIYTHPALQKLSGEALILYGMLYSMQQRGDMVDPEGKKCIHVTIQEIREVFRCGTDKATRIVHELDSIHGGGFLTTKKYGNGQTLTYVRTEL